ncbi:hypothetical protein BGZ76_010342 [Entomortierella beljakovae]|nr:hypothetical protein BGZ76_010342 [Entomortierella beljakovae]
MEMFKSMAAAQLQQYTSGAGDSDDEDKKQTSQSQPQEPNVSTPNESDIHEAKQAHEQVYSSGQTDVSDETLGKAAGTEAFHEFEKSGSEGGKSTLMEMAMAQAMKLMSGGGGGQDKSTVVQGALATATKLYMGKSGEAGGGVSQLMAMFSKGGGEGGAGGAASKVMGMLGDNPQVADLLSKYTK